MSQKTNPLSLRLEKGNVSFSSSWFTDFFFTDTFQYQAQVEKYINSLLKETQYSKAFLSLKNGYRKVNVLLYIQDTRVQQKEKQLLFNVKSSFSRAGKTVPVKKKRFFLDNQEQYYKNFLPEMLLFSLLSSLEVKKTVVETESKALCTLSVKSENANIKNCFFLLFRKKIIESFLKIKQNYNFSVYPRSYVSQSSEEILLFHELCSLNLYPFTKQGFVKPLPNSKFNNIKQYQVNQVFDQTCFWSLYIRQKYLKNKIQDRTQSKALCQYFAFCEKIIRRKILRVSKNFQTPNKTKVLSIFSEDSQKGTIHFEPIRFIGDHQNQISLLDQIIVLLEKRVSFKEIKSKIFRDIEKNELVKGIRISCSGRFGGRSKKAQKSKLQSYQWGENSLNTFSSKVVFASKNANTSYGKIGVKLWLSFKDDCK